MSAKSINIGSDLSKIDAHAITAEEYEEISELTDTDRRVFRELGLARGRKAGPQRPSNGQIRKGIVVDTL
jgi:hypothetical protein